MELCKLEASVVHREEFQDSQCYTENPCLKKQRGISITRCSLMNGLMLLKDNIYPKMRLTAEAVWTFSCSLTLHPCSFRQGWYLQHEGPLHTGQYLPVRLFNLGNRYSSFPSGFLQPSKPLTLMRQRMVLNFLSLLPLPSAGIIGLQLFFFLNTYLLIGDKWEHSESDIRGLAEVGSFLLPCGS